MDHNTGEIWVSEGWETRSQGAHTGYSKEKMVRNGRKFDEIQLSRPQSRALKARNWWGGGGGWAENGGGWGMHPLVNFAPSRTRLDTRQSYLIEFLVVSDHFFIRISSVGSLWLGQQLDVPTQGRRVAQTGTKPISLPALGSDLHPRIEPGLHWWANHSATWTPIMVGVGINVRFLCTCVVWQCCKSSTSSDQEHNSWRKKGLQHHIIL